MTLSDYIVQEHIAELRRVAAQQRLAREARERHAGWQPTSAAGWLNRLFATLAHTRHTQPQMARAVSGRLPELCMEDAAC